MSCTTALDGGPQTPAAHPTKKMSSPSEHDPPTRLQASSQPQGGQEHAHAAALKLSAEWAAVNQALKAQAFSPIRPIPLKHDGTVAFMGRHAGDLVNVLSRLVAQCSATRIDQAVASEVSELHARISNECSISNEMSATIEELRHEIASIKQQHACDIAAANSKLDLSRQHAEKTERDLAQAAQALKSANAAISKQSKDIAELTSRIAGTEQAAAKHSARREAVFQDLMHRRVHIKASVDRKVLDVIDIYEAKLASVARAHEHSTALAAHQPATTSPSEVNGADRHADKQAPDLDSLVMAAKQAERGKLAAVKLAEEQARDIEKLAFENESLRLELQARPSLALWRQTRDRLQRVEAAIAANKASSSPEARESSRAITAAEAGHGMAGSRTHREIEKDKSYFRLGLYRIDEVAADVCREHLKSVCRKFSVKGLDDLPSAVEKIAVMLELMGEARDFTARMARLAHAADPAAASSDRIGDLLESKLRLLDEALSEVESHRSLENRLCSTLGCSPADLLSKTQSVIDELARIKSVAGRWEKCDAILTARKSSPASSSEPDHLVDILGHIQLLFDIPSLAGLLPRMSEVYAHWMELRNALSALRSVLALPASTPTASVVKTVAEKLSQ